MARLLRWGYILLLCLGMALSSVAQNRENPYTLENLVALLEGGVSENRILSLVRTSCRDFELGPEASDRLRQAGASVALLTGLTSACFIDSTPPEPPVIVSEPEPEPIEPENQAPTTQAIPEQRIPEGSSVTIDLGNHFYDPEADLLSYGLPISSDPEVVSATLDRSQLLIDPTGPGVAEITVTAVDREGAEAEITFSVVVSPRPGSNGLAMKLLLGGGAAALAGTAAVLLLGGSSEPIVDPPATPLPGNPGLPPEF